MREKALIFCVCLVLVEHVVIPILAKIYVDAGRPVAVGRR